MRWMLTCLLLLGLCAGLPGRFLGADPCEVMEAMHEKEHSGHHHEPGKPCDPSHDKNCPLEHHGHGCVCHGMPLAIAGDPVIRLATPCLSLTRLRHERETPPDGPFLSEDKPPLI